MSLFQDSTVPLAAPSSVVVGELSVDWDDVFMAELETVPAAPAASDCFKDSPSLSEGALAADPPLPIAVDLPVPLRQLAACYNRVGGLLQRLADATGIELPTLLAVWFVESRGRVHQPGRLRMRFDLARFYADWGARHRGAFARHFSRARHSRDDRFRETPATPFRRLHADPATADDALRVATRLAGAAIAERALCVGEPALPLAEHQALGYASAAEMRRALDDERFQVLGLFDLIRSGAARPDAPAAPGELLDLLRARRFDELAARAHDPNVAPAVASALARTYEDAQALLEPAAPLARPPGRVVYSWVWPLRRPPPRPLPLHPPQLPPLHPPRPPIRPGASRPPGPHRPAARGSFWSRPLPIRRQRREV